METQMTPESQGNLEWNRAVLEVSLKLPNRAIVTKPAWHWYNTKMHGPMELDRTSRKKLMQLQPIDSW
jgi:hypothetical protein